MTVGEIAAGLLLFACAALMFISASRPQWDIRWGRARNRRRFRDAVPVSSARRVGFAVLATLFGGGFMLGRQSIKISYAIFSVYVMVLLSMFFVYRGDRRRWRE